MIIQSSHGQQDGSAGREPLVEPHCRGPFGGHPAPTVPAPEAQDTRVPWGDRGSTCLRALPVKIEGVVPPLMSLLS